MQRHGNATFPYSVMIGCSCLESLVFLDVKGFPTLLHLLHDSKTQTDTHTHAIATRSATNLE